MPTTTTPVALQCDNCGSKLTVNTTRSAGTTLYVDACKQCPLEQCGCYQEGYGEGEEKGYERGVRQGREEAENAGQR